MKIVCAQQAKQCWEPASEGAAIFWATKRYSCITAGLRFVGLQCSGVGSCATLTCWVALEDAIQVYTIYKLRRFSSAKFRSELELRTVRQYEKKKTGSALQRESNELEQSNAKLDFQNASLSQEWLVLGCPQRGLHRSFFYHKLTSDILAQDFLLLTRFGEQDWKLSFQKNHMPSSSMIPHLSREFWP